jgi:hypothetical protein
LPTHQLFLLMKVVPVKRSTLGEWAFSDISKLMEHRPPIDKFQLALGEYYNHREEALIEILNKINQKEYYNFSIELLAR